MDHFRVDLMLLVIMMVHNINVSPSLQSRLKIAGEIAHAISYLHTAFSRPIVHRDIKPGNVFLDQHDVAKLTEFSLSISIPEGETHVEDDVCGTALFLCPNYATTSYIT